MEIGEGKNMKLQIRYADTDEQKEFKAKTQKSRNFKSIEYNVGVALLNSPSSQAYRSPTATNFSTSLQNPVIGSNGVWMSPSPTSPMTPS